MAFSAIRLGAYEPVKQAIQRQTGVESGIGLLFVRMAAGCTTGTMAILAAQPTDVVKIRMQAEVRSVGQKSKYNGVMDAYVNIAKKEGIKGLYKGNKLIRYFSTPFSAKKYLINLIYFSYSFKHSEFKTEF